MAYALWNLVHGEEPTAMLVRGKEDAPPEMVLIVESFEPGMIWDGTNARVRHRNQAERDEVERIRRDKTLALADVVNRLRSSRNPETQAILQILEHRGLL